MLGLQEADRRARTVPADNLAIPDGVNVSLVTDAVIQALDGDMYGTLPWPEILPQYRDLSGAVRFDRPGRTGILAGQQQLGDQRLADRNRHAIMVDDPHRQVTIPAYRYLVHLNAPGLERGGRHRGCLAGVIRGHNGHVAWGRTATETDQADVFVEKVNPANAERSDVATERGSRSVWSPKRFPSKVGRRRR